MTEPKLETINPKNCYVVVKLTRKDGFDKQACEDMERWVASFIAKDMKRHKIKMEVKHTILEPGIGWPPGAIQGIRPIFKEY